MASPMASIMVDEVVGASPGFNPRESIDAAEENIITDDKEDRGEGAALLDPSINVNPDIRHFSTNI